MNMYQVTFEAEVVVTVNATCEEDAIKTARVAFTQQDVDIQGVMDVDLIVGEEDE